MTPSRATRWNEIKQRLRARAAHGRRGRRSRGARHRRARRRRRAAGRGAPTRWCRRPRRCARGSSRGSPRQDVAPAPGGPARGRAGGGPRKPRAAQKPPAPVQVSLPARPGSGVRPAPTTELAPYLKHLAQLLKALTERVAAAGGAPAAVGRGWRPRRPRRTSARTWRSSPRPSRPWRRPRDGCPCLHQRSRSSVPRTARLRRSSAGRSNWWRARCSPWSAPPVATCRARVKASRRSRSGRGYRGPGVAAACCGARDWANVAH